MGKEYEAGKSTTEGHEQTLININGEDVSVDREISSIVEWLNSYPKVTTYASCQGSWDNLRSAWLCVFLCLR